MQTATPAAEIAEFGARMSAVEARLSRVEGIVDQLSQRMANVERRLDWMLGIQFTSWLSIVGLILWKLG